MTIIDSESAYSLKVVDNRVWVSARYQIQDNWANSPNRQEEQ
jgi:hypothetical protein